MNNELFNYELCLGRAFFDTVLIYGLIKFKKLLSGLNEF